MGTLSPGKKADIVEVDKELNVRRVFRRGTGCVKVNEAETAVGRRRVLPDGPPRLRERGPDGGDYQVRRLPSAVRNTPAPRACVPSRGTPHVVAWPEEARFAWGVEGRRHWHSRMLAAWELDL